MNFNEFKHKNKVPLSLVDFLKDKKLRLITKDHTSGDLVYSVSGNYILKISNNIERLKREKEVNDYLINKLSVSKSVIFEVSESLGFYLKTKVKGVGLTSKKYLKDPLKVIKLLGEAMRIIHSVDVSDCKINSMLSEGNTFIHGDFCLPNIIVNKNQISGFIDLEAGGLGDSWYDYAWCIWSLEYNLKTKEYTPILLKELNIDFDEIKYRKYVEY